MQMLLGWVLIVLGILLILLGIIAAAKSVFSKVTMKTTKWWEDLIIVLKEIVTTAGGVFLLFGLILLAVGLDLVELISWIPRA